MKPHYILVAACVLAITPIARATTLFEDGASHNITTNFPDDIAVWDSASHATTTVNLSAPGSLTGSAGGIALHDTSVFNFNGGSINASSGKAIQAFDTSKVFMSAGTVTAQFGILADENASLSVTGGSFSGSGGTGIQCAGNATASLSNLTLSGYETGILNNDFASVTVTSTSIDALNSSHCLFASDSTVTTVSGCSFDNAQVAIQSVGSSILDVYDTLIDDGDKTAIGGFNSSVVNFYSGATSNSGHNATVLAQDSASINIFGGTHSGSFDCRSTVPMAIYGSDFTLNGQPVDGLISVSHAATLAGTLSDGSALSVTLDPNNAAGEQFLIVPEPASLTLLGVGAMGLVLRRQNKKSRSGARKIQHDPS